MSENDDTAKNYDFNVQNLKKELYILDKPTALHLFSIVYKSFSNCAADPYELHKLPDWVAIIKTNSNTLSRYIWGNLTDLSDYKASLILQLDALLKKTPVTLLGILEALADLIFNKSASPIYQKGVKSTCENVIFIPERAEKSLVNVFKEKWQLKTISGTKTPKFFFFNAIKLERNYVIDYRPVRFVADISEIHLCLICPNSLEEVVCKIPLIPLTLKWRKHMNSLRIRTLNPRLTGLAYQKALKKVLKMNLRQYLMI